VEEYVADVAGASAEVLRAGLEPLVVMLAGLAGDAAGAVTLDELEGVVAGRGRELLRGVAQLGLDVQAAGEVRRAGVLGSDGVWRDRVERGRGRRVVTSVGVLRVVRMRYRPRVAGSGSLYPRDAVLELPLSGYSWHLQRLAVMFARAVGFEQAREFLAAATGVTAGIRQIEEIAGAASADAEAFCDTGRAGEPAEVPPGGQEVPPAGQEVALLPLALSADGKGVAVLPESRRERTKAPEDKVQTFEKRAVAGEKKGTKRIAQVSCAFDVIPLARTPEEVMASRHGGSSSGDGGGTAPARARAKGSKGKKGEKGEKKPAPEAVNRRYRADIAKDRSASVTWLFDEAGRRDPARARDWIALVDGDNHQISLIEAEAARRGVTVTILIDLIHVIEYIWKAGWALFPARDPAIEEWAATQVLDILRGHAGQVADRIAALAAANPPRSPEHAKNIRRTTGYLRAKIPYLDYPAALAKGWPVATGVIEGACRHLVADRLGITGARWTTDGAQAILWHRAIHASGDTATYWAYHLRQEHERNHLSKYQNPDTLTLAA
jgi:hypothetical protein